MEEVAILKQEEQEGGWKFTVGVNGAQFTVFTPEEYWQKLSRGGEDPAEFVRRSFRFLLERESKEEILSSFNLKDIEKYFPEYPTEIQ